MACARQKHSKPLINNFKAIQYNQRYHDIYANYYSDYVTRNRGINKLNRSKLLKSLRDQIPNTRFIFQKIDTTVKKKQWQSISKIWWANPSILLIYIFCILWFYNNFKMIRIFLLIKIVQIYMIMWISKTMVPFYSFFLKFRLLIIDRGF